MYCIDLKNVAPEGGYKFGKVKSFVTKLKIFKNIYDILVYIYNYFKF